MCDGKYIIKRPKQSLSNDLKNILFDVVVCASMLHDKFSALNLWYESLSVVKPLAYGRYSSNFKRITFDHIFGLSSCAFLVNWLLVECPLHQWLNVNTGSGNGLVPSGNKTIHYTMLTQIYVAIWRYYHSELNKNDTSSITWVCPPLAAQTFRTNIFW